MKEEQLFESVRNTEQIIASLLNALPATACTEITTLVQCPVFCDSPAARRTLTYMLKRRAKRPQHGFLPEILYWEAYQRKTLVGAKLLEILLACKALVEEFIAWKALKADKMKQQEYVARHAATLPDPAVFRDAVAGWAQAIRAAPECYEKLYQKCRLLQEEWAFWATDRYKSAPILIREILLAHEEYCLTVKGMFDLGSEMRARLFLDKNTDVRENRPINLLVQLSGQVLDLNQKPADEAGFMEVWRQYETCFQQLGMVERESIFRALVNYCTVQMKAGHEAFIAHLSKLCNWAVAKKAFTQRWTYSDEDFLNIAMAFCRPEGLSEMYAYINSHADHLPEHTRNEARALALAYYYFFKGDFDTAAIHLQKVQSREMPYKLRMHSLRIRLQYELGKPELDFEPLETALEAYEKYFDRDEWLQDTRRGNYIRLAWFVRKLALSARGSHLNAHVDNYTFLKESLDDPSVVKPVALEWVKKAIEAERPGGRPPGRHRSPTG